jgi:flavodoxin
MAENDVLVTFFSRTGNTRRIAEFIQQELGCDSFDIQVVDPYPTDYDATVERARRELDSDSRPDLAADLDNTNSYDTVFVGYPCWWGTMPMAVFTFMEAHDLSGKKIAPFCTHEGSRLGRSVKDISALCPRSTVLEALAVKGSTVDGARGEVSEWLRRIGITEAKANR